MRRGRRLRTRNLARLLVLLGTGAHARVGTDAFGLDVRLHTIIRGEEAGKETAVIVSQLASFALSPLQREEGKRG
jgi:hypothetical protein